ncbi:MAG: ankyrin repeat domain-containing protein [Desulfovibrionaceae bacterium]|nr:ankyrin repeat domain-containing protein [Desulfovibrionaceae bacterium]
MRQTCSLLGILAVLLLLCISTNSHAATFELTVEGKGQAHAASTARIQALRQCVALWLTPDEIKGAAVDIHKNVFKRSQELTEVEVLHVDKSSQGVKVQFKITVKDAEVLASLKKIKGLEQALAQKKTPAEAPKPVAEPAPKPAQKTLSQAELLKLFADPKAEDKIAELLQQGDLAKTTVTLDKVGACPALYAYLVKAKAPSVAQVKAFLAAGADASWVSQQGTHSIVEAAFKVPNSEVWRTILAAKPDLAKLQAAHIWPVVAKVLFASNERAELLGQLLAQGLDANICDERGLSLLNVAIKLRSPELVHILLQHQAATNKVDGLGATPLSTAINYQAPLELIELLLKSAADPNQVGKSGQTPLHLAVLAKREDLVQLLLDFKAKIDVQDETGLTPLILASSAGDAAIVKLLLDHGANPNLAAKNGYAPLTYAVSLQHIEIIKLLRAKGADSTAPINFAGQSLSLEEFAKGLGLQEVQDALK